MSSKHHRHHATKQDTKGMKIARNILSFFLFVVIALLSLTGCAKAVFLNSSRFEQIFTNKEYKAAVYQDAYDYATDACDRYSIPYDAVDDVITYSTISTVVDAYAKGNIGNSEKYGTTTYETKLSDIQKQLNNAVDDMLSEYNLNKDNDGSAKFSKDVVDYIKSIVTFEYMDKLQAANNIGETATTVVIIVLAIIGAILALAVCSIGNKKYRGVRAVSYSFIASSIMQLLLVASMGILKQVKMLLIYPTYLCNSVMQYVNNSVSCVAVSALANFLVAIIVIVFVWKLKRDNK